MKRRIWLSGVFLILAFGFLGVRVYESLAAPTLSPNEESAYNQITVFTRALLLIRQDYVDDKKISYHDLIYSALRGMMSNLDPHSQFMEPDGYKEMQDDTKSQFGGLGIVVAVRDGVLTIVSPMEDSPGFKAGLLPGDQILKINGTSTDKTDVNEAVQQLRGEVGGKVALTILRPSTRDIKDYELTREIIKVASVKDAKLLPEEIAGEHKIGYVRITQFNEPTPKELGDRLTELEAKGAQAAIIDLRYNPGGLLESAVQVCSQFLPPGQMVVYTEGRVPSQKKVYRTIDMGKEHRLPLAILINNGSASASEIVSGALKDLNRAIIVGETSFGKGSVQSVIQLPDGSALRLTTAKYYTPSKQVIHEHGVAPNIRATLTPEQDRQLLLARRDDGSLSDGEKRELAGFHDAQLERAADALKGVMIYASRK
jgi:carboxyl-terminal processing protease